MCELREKAIKVGCDGALDLGKYLKIDIGKLCFCSNLQGIKFSILVQYELLSFIEVLSKQLRNIFGESL